MKSVISLACLLSLASSYGESPLAKAIDKNDKEQVRQIISSKDKINEKLDDSSPPLLYALKKKQTAIAELLLSKNADVNAADDEGLTPLMQAGENNDSPLAKLLINKRADINAKASDGSTAIFFFATAGNKDIVTLLLNRGADVNIVNDEGNSPLRCAALSNNLPVFQTILAKVSPKNISDPMKPLMLAAFKGDQKKVAELVNNGKDVNETNALGETALFWAMQRGHSEITKMLIAKGASAKSFSEKLYSAIDNRQFELAKQLIQAGADVNQTVYYGYTPFLIAAKQGNVELLQMLMDKGADTNCREAEGYTPLMLAAQAQQTKAVEFIVNTIKTDVNQLNNKGYTALSGCIDKKTPRKIYEILLKAGAKPIVGEPKSNSDSIYQAEKKKCIELKTLLEKKMKE